MSPWKRALPVLFAFVLLPACTAQVGENTSTSSDAIIPVRNPYPPPNLNFPVINSVWEALSLRGAQPTISGTNFGTTPGRALLFGDFGQYELQVVSWSDTEVAVDWGSLTGVKDQQAQWQIIRADGVSSPKFTAEFTAIRGEMTLPASLVRVAGCSQNGNELNICRLPTSDTIRAEHADNSEVGAVGYDYFVLPQLANGWEYVSYQFNQSQGVLYQEGVGTSLGGWTGGPSLQYLSVEWQALSPGVAQYDINVLIMGPVGVPYQ
jgi:hypothetical protein